MVAFDEQVTSTPIRGPDDLALAIAPSPRGGTALHDALLTALLHTGKERSMVVAFTDGGDNMSWLGEDAVLEVARRTSAVLHAVAILPPALSARAERTELRFLRQLAQSTGGDLWTAPDAAGLLATFGGILDAMRHRYLLRFEPESSRPGWHRLRVRLLGAKGALAARPGYWVEP